MGRMLLGFLLTLSVFGAVRATISDLRLCGDPNCKEPVSKGVTVLSYPSNDKDVLSFPNNAQVLVYSKEAGSRRDLWGVEIKGKRGYAPLKYIREHKIYKSKLNYEVPTEAFKGKDSGEQGKQNLSEESLGQKSSAEEAASDFTKSLKVAISAEDVEYNNLPQATPKEEHIQDEAPTSHVSPPTLSAEPKQDASQPSSSESSTTESNVTQEEDKEVVKEENRNEEEKEDDDGKTEEEKEKEEEDSQEVGKTHEIKEIENTEGEIIDKDKHDEVTEATTTISLPEDDEEEEEEEEEEEVSTETEETVPTASDSVLIEPSEPLLEPKISEPPLPLNPSEVKEKAEDLKESDHLITLEPSSVSFEVIDGTTLYLDEDTSTATTTSRDSQTSELPSALPVLGDVAATLPIPALFHHSPPTSPPKDAKVEDSKLTSPEIDPSQAVDSVPLPDTETATDEHETASENMELPVTAPDAETVIKASEEENESVAEQAEPQLEDSDEESLEEIDINDFGSPLAEDKGPEEAVPTREEPHNEFGSPKEETIIKSTDVPTEKPVESEGFFSSWFGSSETPDPPEAEGTPETSVSNKSEAPLDDTVVLEDTSSEDVEDLEDTSVGETTNDTDIPPDDISVPVDESEGANIVVQVPYDTEDVDESAANSPQSNLSSVESNSSASPDVESSPDVLPPTSGNAFSTDLGHSAIDTTDGSEKNADSYLGDEGNEPGPSTARPMYAEPEPTTQSYTDSNVDPDELARLAGTGETAEVDAKESRVEESLTEKFLKASHSMLPEGMAFGVEAEVAEPEMSQGALVFLSIVVATIVTIYLVHLIMLKLSRESPILEALNNMDQEKRILLHENTTLHEELCKAHDELKTISSRITDSSEDVSDLDTQLELIKREHAAETAQQEEKIVQLEHELEEATSNSIEMHKMLSEMLSAQKDTSTFQASVDHLQEMLDGQQEKVEALNSDLALKTRLNEELHLELSSSREQVNKLDSQVQQLTQSLKELSVSKEETSQQLLKDIELVKDLQNVNDSLSKQSVDHDHQLSDLNQELETLRDTIANLRESVETKDSELQVAKECLKMIQLNSEDSKAPPDDEKLSSLFDVITVKAELQRITSERLNLDDQLRESEVAQKNLEDTMSSIRSEVTDLRLMHDEAVHEKQEALSKLAVLTQYFEEKEAQLTKELESQEGLRMNAEGTAASVEHKIQNYELETTSYKVQVQSLRKELQDQEMSYKTQLDSCEKKAHDNWLQARAAERKHEEQRQENSQLRNRLTLLQKEREDIHGGILKPTPKRLDANGRMPSPGPIIEREVDGEHSESPPHPLHGPPSILPMMLPPGAPLPPGIPPPHGFPGAPPPPPPPGMPRGVPPFHPGEFSFMRPPLPPLPGDRRLPPAGGMSSPPFRRSGSPSYSHRNDRYSPNSEHSHLSDRHYSPPPMRHRPPSPDMHRRNHSPDRRSDRLRSPDRRSDRVRASPDHHRSNRRTPDRRLDRRSPDRHFSTRSPDGYHRRRSSPHDYYDHSDYNSDDSRLLQPPNKGKKTSTPLGSSDRWRNDV